MTKETPIIMSGDMIRAILDGRKTMTRRVISPNFEAKGCRNDDIVRFCNTISKDAYMFEIWHPSNKNAPLPLMIRCPYGQVGDCLWVRETWAVGYEYDALDPSGLWNHPKVYYKADDLTGMAFIGKTRTSMFMPRWASRIERIITLLRAERLRDISPADAQAEGGYTRDEFIKLFLKINHLPEDANPWNWVIGW